MRPNPGEQVLFHGHASWRSMLGFYVKGVLFALFAGVVAGLATTPGPGRVQAGWVMVAVLAVFACMLAAGLGARARTTYTITDRRLTIERGVVARAVSEAQLNSVQNVSLRQTLLERLLRVGTIDFETFDYDFSFRGVSEPRRLARTVEQARRQDW